MQEKYWIASSLIKGVGGKTLKKLYDEFNSFEIAWKASDEEIRNIFPFRNEQCEKFIKGRKRGLSKAENIISTSNRENIGILTMESRNYPSLLFELEKPPPILYYKGTLPDWNSFSISIVGTRNPTENGRHRSREISREIARKQGIVVSGLAYGIDTQGHKGCLDENGITISVLGNGLLSIYPSENRELAKDIIENGGLILSEVPIHYTQPKAWSLRERNRIISALSDLTIVVEASKNSGSLITARHSRNMGKPVIVPGPLKKNLSEHQGLYRIIKTGGIEIPYSDNFLNEVILETGYEMQQHQNQDSLKLKKKDTPTNYLVRHDNLSEDDYIRGILYIIGKTLKEKNLDLKYLNEIKLQKSIFSIIKNESIPVTYSWYKRGVYIHSSIISMYNLRNYQEYEKYLSSNEISTLQKNFLKTINFKDFYVSTNQYLDKLYRKESPEEYRDIYISVHKLLKYLKKISRKNLSSNQMTLNEYIAIDVSVSDEIEPLLNDFKESISNNEKTSFMSNKIVNLCDKYVIALEKVTDTESVEQERVTLDSLINLFFDYLWKYPASVVSRNTVVGPKADQVKSQMDFQIKNHEEGFNILEKKLDLIIKNNI